MQVIQDTLAQVKVETETTFRNLTMFPLLNGGSRQPDYLTLDEALAQDCVHITEVSAGGSVPELKFVNESDQHVLLLDGEELVGAKQNRVLNLTILAPARCTLIIPVSCVEAGRWAHRSAEFASAMRAQYAGGRARKMSQVTDSLRFMGRPRSDQSAVWADIEAKAERLDASSPTQAMAAMYEKHATSIEDYVRAFSATDGQVGALFAIGDEIIGFDLFDYAETLRKLLPKLVRSYGLDALDAQMEKPPVPARSAAEELLLAVARAEAQRFPALGEGEDVRLTRANLTGGALVADGRVIHLSAFHVKEEPAEEESFPSRLIRPSARRQQQPRRSYPVSDPNILQEHNFVNGKCKSCGSSEVAVAYFGFRCSK